MSSSGDDTPDVEAEITALRAQVADYEERERELRASERILRLVMDTVPMRMFWKDRDYRYLGCNRIFAEDAGLASPEELIDRHDFELSWRESADAYRADDRAVIEGGRSKVDFGNYIAVNPAGCRMLGYSERELCNMNMRDLVDEGDHEGVALCLDLVAAGRAQRLAH